MAPVPFMVKKHASVADARLAYLEGEFGRCLEICANIRVGTLATASEVALITARAYLRTGRPYDAQRTLLDTRDTHTTLDESLTAEMLLATARIRQGDADTGIAMLAEAQRRSGGAHFAIRSEIALCTALGHWAKREIDLAETCLERVDPRSDIIHARALELQAWCHSARRDYRRSAEYFRLTLLRLDECAMNDRAIKATAISSLAIFAAELFDAEIARFVEMRAQDMDWPAELREHHYVTLEHQALFAEFSGNTVKAYQLAAQAREHAATVPAEIFGWALCSSIARNAGEGYSAFVFAQRARDLLGTFDARELYGEERFSILSVAENWAHFDPKLAAELYATYRGLSPIDPMLALAGDSRQTADETHIAGVIAQASGDHDRAVTCYREAFQTFRDLSYVRRAIRSAHALLALCDDADVRRYTLERLAGTSNYVTDSLRRQEDAGGAELERDPILASLPRSQREVVGLICLGKTNKEIAQLRNVGEQTIKNMLTKSVFPAFGVSCRAALVSACLREGVGPHR